VKHEMAPLFDALRRFVEREQAPFYSPGHKGGRTLDPGSAITWRQST